MFKKIALFFTLALIAVFAPSLVSAEVYGAGSPVTIYFFHSESCPHCRAAEPYLKTLDDKYENISLQEFEVSKNADNLALLQETADVLNAKIYGVPVIIIGTDYMSGWDSAQTSGRELESMIAKYAGKRYYSDPTKEILNNANATTTEEAVVEKNPNAPDENRNFPLLGEVNLKNVSLPLLAVALGFVDGFNPCAMWVLVFLIGLLLGMGDRKKMFILGSLFIFISALSYYIFMAAWLNLLLFIGLIFWVKIGIGILALVFGGLNLKDFFTKKVDECKVSGFAERQKLTDKVRNVIHQNKFWLSVVGIIGLGFSVNLVELLCSAGFPAVFTEVLTLSGISKAGYYGHMLIYIFFYMLDDLVIFFTAMFLAERATGLNHKYLRASKLIGGTLMVIIGILMIFKPEWLMG